MGDDVQITVADKGPGIAKEHLASVTDAFYRPDTSRDRKTGGIGLGLYLCQKIALAHGGKFVVKSPVDNGLGTSVTVSLPRTSEE